MEFFVLNELFQTVCSMSVTASIIILFVLLIRLLLKRAPKIFSYALWAVVLFRLLCPVSISADFALLGLLDTAAKESDVVTYAVEYVQPIILETDELQLTFPVITVDDTQHETQSTPQKQPTADQTVTPDTPKMPTSIAAYVWLAGIFTMLLYNAVSYRTLRRKLVGAMSLRKNIYHADHINSPFVMGLVRPKIYLPSYLSEKEQAYIILHEQCHIRRLDHVIKTLAFAALCIHWFNPLVWIAFVLSGKDMEMSCDEAVIKKLGAAIRAEYSASLLSLATGRKIIASRPLAFGEGNTKGRIKNLLHWKKPRLWISAAATLTCIIVIVACAANPTSPTDSNDPSSDAPSLPSGISSETEADLVARFAFNETLQNLLDEVNSEHEAVKMYDGDYYAYRELNEEPDFDFSQYNYADGRPDNDTVLTLEDLKADMEIYYKGLRTTYGGYTLFGGDEAFRPAIDAVIADCAAMDIITCADVVDSVQKHFSFVKDAQFFFNGWCTGKYAVPFFFRNVAYQKTEKGYETPDGKVVASVDGFEDLDELFKLSLTKEGDLVYYPVLLESFLLQEEILRREVNCSTQSLTVRYADGSVDELTTEPYVHLLRYTLRAEMEPLTIREENGVPIIATSEFSMETYQEFRTTAFTTRNRDLLILDLRTNPGGNLFVGWDWARCHSLQDVWTNSRVGLVMPSEKVYEHYQNSADREFVSTDNTRIILTSKYTASAAEGFVDLAYNMENTMIVGENTWGAYTCGSDYRMTLPNTGMLMHFGRGPILHPEGDYFEEMRGFYPDIWCPQAEAEEAVMNFIEKNTTVTYETSEQVIRQRRAA